MPKRPNLHAQITHSEALRAIYIDGEGFQDHPPALLGILIEDEFEQVVLDRDFDLVAKAKDHRTSTLQREADTIVSRAADEKRVVVAYSQHELKVFDKFSGVDLSSIYRDARMIAKRWRNRLYPHLRGSGNDLKSFLKLIGYERGSYLGNQQTTQRIRYVRDMVE